MVNVRLATVNDETDLLFLGVEMHAESPRYRGLDFSLTKTRALIVSLTSQGTVIVAEDESGIVGMLGYVVFPHYFGEDKIATDVAVYVAPSLRGRTFIVRMIAEFERGARERGAVEFALAASCEIETDRTVKLFERLGYRRSSIGTLKKA